MAGSLKCLALGVSIWLAMAGRAAGQATVEAGMAAAGSATGSAASAKGVGNAIRGIAAGLDKALKSGPPAEAPAPSAKKQVANKASEARTETAESAAPPAPKFEDPDGIEKGLAYPELLRRFGPPSLEITGETGRSAVYAGKRGSYRIEVQDDQVVSVRKPQA